MKKVKFNVVIGKNFGDEGKGMAVDMLSTDAGRTVVIRHNGGSQSGHTVEKDDIRFVFHALGSGSLRGADTFWADTFYPDLYKLGEECSAFLALTGFVPRIYAMPDAQITLIDDVLLNMAAEVARGADRHGSCGMGIYEAYCRSEAGFAVTVEELVHMNSEQLVMRMAEIRRQYVPVRLAALGFGDKYALPEEYAELLENSAVLENAAESILANLKYVQIITDVKAFLDSYDTVIFENGQGLLLDSENTEFAPHVTASRTGLHNPVAFLSRFGFVPERVVYVTRSYVTRHGAGPLPFECKREHLGIEGSDLTNIPNPWQESLRYASHGTITDFIKPVAKDLSLLPERGNKCECLLLITHLNETHGKILLKEEALDAEGLGCRLECETVFDSIAESYTRFSKDIIVKDF